MEIPMKIEKVEYIENPYELPVNSDSLSDNIINYFTMEQKKRIRTERYQNCTEQLNHDLFYQLLSYKLLSVDFTTNNGGKPKNKYEGNFVWDIETLEKLEIDEKDKKNKKLQ